MNVIKGIYEAGIIKPIQPIPVNENFMVTITFVKPLRVNSQEIYKSTNDEFLLASESSIDFWLNDIDDKVWNNV